MKENITLARCPNCGQMIALKSPICPSCCCSEWPNRGYTPVNEETDEELTSILELLARRMTEEQFKAFKAAIEAGIVRRAQKLADEKEAIRLKELNEAENNGCPYKTYHDLIAKQQEMGYKVGWIYHTAKTYNIKLPKRGLFTDEEQL